jgi:hypothetical protein
MSFIICVMGDTNLNKTPHPLFISLSVSETSRGMNIIIIFSEHKHAANN